MGKKKASIAGSEGESSERGRKKVSFAGSEAESTKRGEKKRPREEEEEISSKKPQAIPLTAKERSLLKGDSAVRRYNKFFANRELELGRYVDFEWLEKERVVDIDLWLNVVGWNEFVMVKEPVYPRLVRILYANLNPDTMTSCIGNIQVKLDIDTWCRTFNIPNLTDEEEASVRSLSREEIFRDLFGREGLGIRSWVNVGELPKHPTIRLATTILMNVIVPKKGSKEQIKEEEEEGRILYTLKHGFNLNVAKDIVERIRQICIRKSTPLCYVMHLMIIMKNAGVNLKCAGDVDIKELKKSSHIDARTLGRLGFKHDITDWVYVGRGKVKTRTYTAESQPQFQSRTEGQDTREEQERTVEGEQAAEATEGAEASSIPQPSTSRARSPSFPSIPTSQLSKQIVTLQTNLSNQMTHITSHISEKMDYFMASVNSKLENMDTKLDDIIIRVKACETKLSQSKPPSQSTPPSQPKPPSQSEPPSQPKPSSQPTPVTQQDPPSKQKSPQIIPSSSSSSSSFTTSSSVSPIRPISPISTMPKDAPTEPTQTQTLAIEPPPPPEPPQEQPQPSETPQPATPPSEQPQTSEIQSPEKTQAAEIVKKILKLPRTTRIKKAVSKQTFKIVPRK